MYKDCIGKPLILLMPHGIKSASLALRLPNAQMYKYGFLIVDFIYSVVLVFFQRDNPLSLMHCPLSIFQNMRRHV